MEATCPNGDAVTITDPTGPTPGGKVGVKCPVCGASFEVDNPQGDETYTFAEETWLFPVMEEVPAARGTTQRDITGYTVAPPGAVGAVRFGPGQQAQKRLLPADMSYAAAPAPAEGGDEE